MEAAAGAGHLHVCCWLRQQGVPWGDSLASAAEKGHRFICEWMVANGCPSSSTACHAAARAGDWDTMVWLRQLLREPHAWEVWDVAAVAEGCDLAALQRAYGLWRQVPGDDSDSGSDGDGDDDDDDGSGVSDSDDSDNGNGGSDADEGDDDGNHPGLPLPLQQLPGPEPQPEQAQAQGEQVQAQGQAQVQEQPVEPPPQPPPQPALAPPPPPAPQPLQQPVGLYRRRELILAHAAASKRPDWREKVTWLLSQGFPRVARGWWDAVALPDAVERHEWLRVQQGFEIDSFLVTLAAIEGNLPALEYLVEVTRSSLADHNVYIDVPREGHLHVLRFFHARGRLGRFADCAAEGARHGHTAMVLWLVQDVGVGVQELEAHEVDVASLLGDVGLLAWLRERGWRWRGDSMAFAAKAGCEEALDWMLDHGCPMPDDGQPYVLAAGRGDLGTLRWLRRRGCPWGSADTFTRSVNGNVAVSCVQAPMAALRWLLEQGCPVDWEAAVTRARARRDWEEVVEMLEGERRRRGEGWGEGRGQG